MRCTDGRRSSQVRMNSKISRSTNAVLGVAQRFDTLFESSARHPTEQGPKFGDSLPGRRRQAGWRTVYRSRLQSRFSIRLRFNLPAVSEGLLRCLAISTNIARAALRAPAQPRRSPYISSRLARAIVAENCGHGCSSACLEGLGVNRRLRSASVDPCPSAPSSSTPGC